MADRSERTFDERFVLTTAIILMLVNQTGIVIISPLAIEIAETFDTSVSAAGQLRTVAALVSGLLAPFVGLMSDRIGRRPIILVGLTAMGACGLLSAIAPWFAMLLAVQLLAGIGIAALLSVGYALVGDFFTGEKRAWAIGIISIGQPMAWVIGLPLIGLIADNFGWRWSFIGVPVMFSVLAMLLAFRMSLPSRTVSAPNLGVAELRGILRNRSAAAWIGCELLAYSGWAGTLVYLGAYYISSHGQSITASGILLASAALAFAGGSLISHRIASRSSGKVAILGGAFLSALALITALAFDTSLSLAVMLLGLFAFAQGIRGAAASTLALVQAPDQRGAMMGFRASVVQFGYVIGGSIGGVLLVVGSYALLGVTFGIVIALAAVLMTSLVQDRSVTTSPATREGRA